jgi:hypothetical protein
MSDPLSVLDFLFDGDDGLRVHVHPVQPVRVKGDTEKRFEVFHLRNPHVYEAIVQITLDLKRRGFKKGGIRGGGGWPRGGIGAERRSRGLAGSAGRRCRRR